MPPLACVQVVGALPDPPVPPPLLPPLLPLLPPLLLEEEEEDDDVEPASDAGWADPLEPPLELLPLLPPLELPPPPRVGVVPSLSEDGPALGLESSMPLGVDEQPAATATDIEHTDHATRESFMRAGVYHRVDRRRVACASTPVRWQFDVPVGFWRAAAWLF